MPGRRKPKRVKKRANLGLVVVLEHEPAEDAAERLLQVYEFLLGLPELSETCSEREEST